MVGRTAFQHARVASSNPSSLMEESDSLGARDAVRSSRALCECAASSCAGAWCSSCCGLQPRNLGAELAILVRRLRNEGSKLSSRSADWDVAGALVQYCDNRSSYNGGSISGWGGLLAQEEARRAIEAHTHAHKHHTHVRQSISLIFSSFARISGAARLRSHMADGIFHSSHAHSPPLPGEL